MVLCDVKRPTDLVLLLLLALPTLTGTMYVGTEHNKTSEIVAHGIVAPAQYHKELVQSYALLFLWKLDDQIWVRGFGGGLASFW